LKDFLWYSQSGRIFTSKLLYLYFENKFALSGNETHILYSWLSLRVKLWTFLCLQVKLWTCFLPRAPSNLDTPLFLPNVIWATVS